MEQGDRKTHICLDKRAYEMDKDLGRNEVFHIQPKCRNCITRTQHLPQSVNDTRRLTYSPYLYKKLGKIRPFICIKQCWAEASVFPGF